MERQWEFRYSLRRPPSGGVVELSAQEMEQFLLKELEQTKDHPERILCDLSQFYSSIQRHDKALACLRKVLDRTPDAERKAACVLAMGAAMEQAQDFESAIRYYREALGLEPVANDTWYFINNNLGFSLNTQGKFEEGEIYCRRAIKIDPKRPNGHKNLGISFQGQGRWREAAGCFITATQVNASDRRSFDLLTKLLADHPELEFEFGAEAECCRQAVGFAAGEAEKLMPVVHRGFKKRLFLLRIRIKSWLRRLGKRGRQQP